MKIEHAKQALPAVTRLNADLWLGVGFGAAAILGVCLIPFEVGPIGTESAMLPLIGACSCLVFAIALAVQSLQTSRLNETPELSAELDEADAPLTIDARVRLTGVFLIVAAHAMLLTTLGLGIAGISLQILLFLTLGVRNLAIILLVPIANIIVIHVLISGMLGVPLPDGQLHRWFGF